MRPLLIDDAAKAEAARVLAHAETHPFHVGAKWIPGDDPGFVADICTYRCVFTYTTNGGVTFRHLIISVPGAKYPNPAAVMVLADAFGFTGWDGDLQKPPVDWGATVDEKAHCVVVVQSIARGRA